MSLTLEAAIDYIQKLMRDVEGMREAPNKPPGKIGLYPFATCYPAQGVVSLGEPQGYAAGRHALALELHVARKNLPNDMELILPFVERVIAKFRDDPTLGGTVTTVVGDLTYTFGPLNWFGQETLGWQFLVTVKIVHQ